MTPTSLRLQIIYLAWPVLVQQFLVFLVLLSDQFLAGYFQPIPKEQQAVAVGHRLMAAGNLLSCGMGVSPALVAETPWELGREIMARHVAYQSAQTTAHYLAWVISSYAVLVTVGSTALTARFVGAGEWVKAIHATNQSAIIAVILGVLGSLAGFVGLEHLIAALQIKGDAAQFLAEYLRPLLLLMPFQLLELAGIACLVGAGDTRTGMWVLGGVAIINVPLAWSFFHGLGPIPGLGFEGIAWGTALSHLLGSLAVVSTLTRGRAGLKLRLSLLRPAWDLMHRLLRVSVPAGLDSLSLAAGHLWFLSIVNRLGDVAGAAHGIALRWEALGYLSGGAIGTAAMTLVGQYLGARRPDLAARSGWTAFALGCGLMSLMGLLFAGFAPWMFLLFCQEPEQQPVIAAGVPVLRLVAFAMPALASCIIFTYALRGAGDTRIPLLFTWIGFLCVRIPLAIFLTSEFLNLGPLGTWRGANLGLFGAWLAMFADLMVRGGFFLVRYAGGKWQRIEV